MNFGLLHLNTPHLTLTHLITSLPDHRALEAFYVNSIRYYQNIPSSKYNSLYVGQPYQNVEQGLDAVGYDIGNYRQDLVGLLLDGIGWSLFALFLMVVTHRDKKR